MSTNVLQQLETTPRTVKRAQYEALEFALVPDGIQVRNNSHANPADHEYLVTVNDGIPTSCTCPADEKYSGACKHRIAIAIRQPILDAVRRQQLVADGGIKTEPSTGNPVETEDETEEDDDRDCDCAELPDDFPCWECFHSGRRELPSD